MDLIKMPDKKKYNWIFYLSEKAWSMGGMRCPDCVDESNYEEWKEIMEMESCTDYGVPRAANEIYLCLG